MSAQVASVYCERFRVHFYEAEPDGRVTVPALCRYMQEAADADCRSAGVSLAELRNGGRTWLLTRFGLQLNALPRLGDNLVIQTWGSNRSRGIRAYRDFRLLNASGNIFGEAVSLWIMLDLNTRRPLRLSEDVLSLRRPERVHVNALDEMVLEAPAQTDCEQHFRVLWRDLDANEHANYVSYIEWALETIPAEVRRNKRLFELDVEYKGEAFLGQEVISSAECESLNNGTFYRAGMKTVKGKELAVVRTGWSEL